MYLKLVPDNTDIKFIALRFTALIFSSALILGSIAALFLMGLNFGIDFRGGVSVEIASEEGLELGEVRSVVSGLGLGDVQVQEVQDVAGAEKGVMIFIERQEVEAIAGEDPEETVRRGELAQQEALTTAQDAIVEAFGEEIDFRNRSVVGATVSGELIQKGVIAVTLAIAMMLIYIWFRFEWQFSLGAIIALVHDVAITMGMFAVTKLEFNLSIIAAILTIVGYSMNDTVVVYDRVRENLRKFKSKPLDDLLNLSINDTLSRTVMTSGTTLLALISLAVFGGEVLRGFTLAMIWGIVIGTYSSIFVASPVLLATGVKRDWSGQPATATP